MALIKTFSWKTIDLEYWIITEYIGHKSSKRTLVTLTPFKNLASRTESLDNGVIYTQKQVDISGYGLTLHEMYMKILDLTQQYIYIVQPEIKDSDGNIIQTEITETRDYNWFKDSVSDV